MARHGLPHARSTMIQTANRLRGLIRLIISTTSRSFGARTTAPKTVPDDAGAGQVLR